MKLFRKLTLWTVLFSAFTLALISCSDDNKDSDIEKPNAGKMLPSRIKIMDSDELYADYEFSYNEKNQLVKYFDNKDPEEGDRPFKYDDKGRLIQFDEGDYYDTYTYKDDKTVLFVSGNQDPNNNIVESSTYLLNDKGLMIENIFTVSYSDGRKDETRTYFTYDTDNNVSVSTTNKETTEASYHKEFSPFCNMGMPSYFMLWDDNWGIQTTGKHMMSKIITNNTNNIIDWKEEYTIVKSENNYPTEIKRHTFEPNDEGKLEEYSVTTYIIEYQEMK